MTEEKDKESKQSRRDFLKYTAGGVVGVAVGAAAAYGLVPPVVKEVPGPAVTQTATMVQTAVSTVAPAEARVLPAAPTGDKTLVAITKLPDNAVTREAFETAARQQIDLLGGWSKFESLVKGKKVVIKPNIKAPNALQDKLGHDVWKPPWPTEGYKASYTHPHLMRALHKMADQAGAAQNIFAENSVSGSTPFCMKVGGYTNDIADLPYVKVSDLAEEKVRQITIPNPMAHKWYAQPDSLKDAVLITVPKIKIHGSSYLTYAAKNHIGIQPANTYGGSSAGSALYGKKTRTSYDAMADDVKINAYNSIQTPEGLVNGKMFNVGRGHGMADLGYREIRGITDDAQMQRNSYGDYVLDPYAYQHSQIADLQKYVPTSLVIGDGTSGCAEEGALDFQLREGGVVLPEMYRGIKNMKAVAGAELLLGGYGVVATDIVAAQVMGWSQDELLWETLTGRGSQAMEPWYVWKQIGGMLDARGIQVVGVDKVPNANFRRAAFATYSRGSAYNTGKAYPPAILDDYKA